MCVCACVCVCVCVCVHCIYTCVCVCVRVCVYVCMQVHERVGLGGYKTKETYQDWEHSVACVYDTVTPGSEGGRRGK